MIVVQGYIQSEQWRRCFSDRWKSVKFGEKLPNLIQTDKKIFGADNRQFIDCLGFFIANFTWDNQTSQQKCYVCKNAKFPLLVKSAINDLGTNILQPIFSKRIQIFTGLGKIKVDLVHIEINENSILCHLAAPCTVPVKATSEGNHQESKYLELYAK